MMLASTSLQSLVQVAVLPLVLHRFDAATVALWALFSAIASFSSIATSTITITYVRAVAFAIVGAESLDDISVGRRGRPGSPPNLPLLAQIVAGARTSFNVIAAGLFAVLATGGSALVYRIVTATSTPDANWLAWGLVVVGTSAMSFGNTFVGYLEGHNHVALVRRWDAIFALFAAASSLSVLVVNGTLLWLVASTQLWVVLRVVRNQALCRKVEDGRYNALPRTASKPAVRALWPAVWRSFVGVALIVGTNQAGGIFYAQVGEPRMVAMYLLAMRILDVLSLIARAPFTARVPHLVRLYAQGDMHGVVASARPGMRYTYWLFVAGLLAGAALGPPIFHLVGSRVPFPPYLLWLALGGALMLERFGAMHLQLYSTTNQIIWHKVALGYAFGYVTTILILGGTLNVYAFPVAMFVGYLGWHSWFSARHSYRTFELRFWSFERALVIPPFAIIVAAIVVAWVLV